VDAAAGASARRPAGARRAPRARCPYECGTRPGTAAGKEQTNGNTIHHCNMGTAPLAGPSTSGHNFVDWKTSSGFVYPHGSANATSFLKTESRRGARRGP
jgi:hypothetical protein